MLKTAVLLGLASPLGNRKSLVKPAKVGPPPVFGYYSAAESRTGIPAEPSLRL